MLSHVRPLLVVSVVVTAIAGCVPEKRVKWSPDGGVAAVRIGSELHLCDPNGVLSPTLVEDVADMEWIAGARLLVLVRAATTGKWSEVEPLLDPARRDDLVRRAPELRDAIIAYKGEWREFNTSVLDGVRDEERAALLLLMKERYADELGTKAPSAWEVVGKTEAPIHMIHLAQVDGVDKLTLGEETFRSLAPITRPTPSPDGRNVAFVRPLPELRTELLVAPLRPAAQAKRVAASITGTFAWVSDGKQLVYATASNSDVSGSDPMLIAVQRASVVGADGEILKDISDGTRLVFALVDGEPSVSAALDGSVVFAALDASLPVAAPDLVRRNALFVVAPGDQIQCARMTPKRLESDLPDVLALFAISPDGQHIAIADPDSGRLLIYTPTKASV